MMSSKNSEKTIFFLEIKVVFDLTKTLRLLASIHYNFSGHKTNIGLTIKQKPSVLMNRLQNTFKTPKHILYNL